MERWKWIKNFEGLYKISDKGAVFSFVSGKVLKGHANGKDYKMIGLHKDKKTYRFLIHRLVAQAFIPNLENKKEVDHINTIKDDNRVENLRWVSHKENCENELTREHLSGENSVHFGKPLSEETKVKLSKAMSGENHHMYGKHHSKETKAKISKSRKGKPFSEEHKAKLSGENHPRARVVRCIELDKIFTTIKEAKEVTGASGISACCRGKCETSGGYHWEYVDSL